MQPREPQKILSRRRNVGTSGWLIETTSWSTWYSGRGNPSRIVPGSIFVCLTTGWKLSSSTRSNG